VKQESGSNWEQLGSLANGVLRTAAEKRRKHAEFMAAERGAFEAPLEYTPQAGSRTQLVLPLNPSAKPLANVSAGRV
jgi:hypothetical protein